MTGKEIVASVLRRTGVSSEDFFGNRRARQLTEARVMAILELTELGLSASAIGRIVRRDHVTVLYWQRPEMRAARKAKYAALYVPRPRPAPKPKRAVKSRKAKPKDRAERHQCFYTAEEDTLARDLFARGAGKDECLRILGRDRNSVRNRIRLLDDPVYRAQCHNRDRDRHEKRRERAQSIALRVPRGHEAMFEQARIRTAAQRTLTASFFGDPPPGFSALDIRNREARI